MPRMHGPSFADGQTIVNSDVHANNVKAFQEAGWKKGEAEDAPEASVFDAKYEKDAAKAEKAAETEEAPKGKTKK